MRLSIPFHKKDPIYFFENFVFKRLPTPDFTTILKELEHPEYLRRIHMKDTIKLENKHGTLIVAHRGVPVLEQENTVPAFVAACNRSYFGVECDIHVTRDGKYIVCHDDDTARICDKKLRFDESDFSDLRALKVKGKGSQYFDETLILPTLEEYLRVMQRYDKVAVIELKGRMSDDNIREIIEICKTVYSLDKIIFITFEANYLIAIRAALPEQKVQLLTDKYSQETRNLLIENKFDLDIGHWLLNEEIVKDLHAHGIQINCWTCDDADKAQQYIDWGVEYITTNMLE